MSGVGRAIDIATAAALAALVALLIGVGDPLRPGWWPHMIPFALWAAAPLIAPWLVRRRRPAAAAPALVGLLGALGVAVFAYGQAFFVSTSSTAALALVFVPLWQWAWLLALGLAVITSQWLRRRA